jgi:periodic tryptophan protein 1
MRCALLPPADADGSIEAALAELDMEHYDDEDDEGAGAARLFGGSGRPTYYASNEEDPYITLHEEDDEEEVSDFTLRPTGACGPGRRCTARVARRWF